MHKKKIQTLLVAGLLTVTIAGATLAWFTSQDEITNRFNTGSVTDLEDGLDAGIDVQENFPNSTDDGNGNMIYDNPVLPGDQFIKEVWVESTASYNQIVRARVVKNFIDKDTGQKVTHYYIDTDGSIKYGTGAEDGSQALKLEYIQLGDNLSDNTNAPAGWTVQTNGEINTSSLDTTNWYYYNEVVTPYEASSITFKTSDLLKTVTLSNEAGNEYKNLTFDVKVEAEAIQSSNGAINDESVWQYVPDSIKALNK